MDNPRVNVNDADVPPPPYSETDIYSNSGIHPSTASTTPHTGLTPWDDTSSTGEVVYTPPLTPRTSSNTHLESQRPAQDLGAAAYFDLRPPPPSPPTDTLVRIFKIKSASVPDDLPHENEWTAKDVTAQDWATFLNFLLPDHTTRENEVVIQRKLRSEARGETSSTSGRSQAETQLEQMRENGVATARSRSEIEATVQQWNEGFFGPRGMNVRLELETDVPGAWGPKFEHFEQQREQPSQRHQGDNNPSGVGNLSIGSHGIRYGDTMVLDSNGMNISSLTMDNEGISMGKKGQPSGTAAPSQTNFAGLGGQTGRRGTAGPTRPSWTFGGRSGWDRSRRDRRDYHHGDYDRHHDRNDWHYGHDGWRDREDRGRRWCPDRKDRHDRSQSVSSISSDSSSSSESSIGSLPDYEDIKDHQLPLYAERLQAWASRPEQVRTKSDIKALKAELKSVPEGPVDPNFSRKALKGQIKGLQTSWKAIKRAQRQNRKAYRRERRMQRKAEKRECRNQRREMKRAHKEHRRHGRPFHASPAAPPGPPGLLVSPAPPAPPGPTAGPNPPPWTHNWPRGCTGPSQRSSFFFGPDGPLGEQGPFGPHGPLGAASRGGLFSRGGWDSWDGGRSRGCRVPGASQSSASCARPRNTPGAWPGEDYDSGTASHAPPPGPVAAAKYKAAERIEAEMSDLVTRAADAKEGKGAMEKEIEALSEKLELVRMEADEAYARELAE
ncbi:hypothetical protein NOR_06312 [Metarhizium rileyi]|uniref:RING finger domain-containing protein n=1 Tax=Metarhizium rileyi (strain RCEF 4871) TaxID=1649241 RepID=A0A167AZ03_METRR|nr:hypothetical protein NOR_06312 [Metarhizium rileyi RCEF 4871]